VQQKWTQDKEESMGEVRPMRHVISERDFPPEWVRSVLDGGIAMMEYAHGEGQPSTAVNRIPRPAANPKATLLFLEPSTRTAGSFEEAARLLGFDVKPISGSEALALGGKNESYADTARMLGRGNQGASVLVIRSKIEGSQRFMAEILNEMGYDTAVLNGGDNINRHPTQALLDYTYLQHVFGADRLKDLTIGIVGDLSMSRVAHSDLEIARLLGIQKVRLVSPPESRIQRQYVRSFMNLVEGDSLELLADCDVVTVLRVQVERYTDPIRLAQVKGRYTITRQVLDSWKKDVVVMHPLPCIDEIDRDIYMDPRMHFFRQAEIAIPTRMHLLAGCFEALDQEEPPPAPDKLFEYKVLVSASVDQHLEDRAERRDEHQHFRPVRNGVIIDHLPVGSGPVVRQLLRKRFKKEMENGGAVLGMLEGVTSGRTGRKDVIVTENIFPDNAFWGALKLLFPDATPNVARDETFEKLQFGHSGTVPGGMLCCPNTSCINNNDPEAKDRTRFELRRIQDPSNLADVPYIFAVCHYCEREFTGEQMLNALT